MKGCPVCGSNAVETILDCGKQPVCNRFLAAADAPEYLHPLALAVCRHCGLVQLAATPPPNEVRPRFDWITYNEPEGHLDHLSNTIAQLPGLSSDAVIGGFTYKDDSTLRRLRERGFAKTWRLDPELDFGISDPAAGLETVQARWDRDMAERVATRRGRPDVLLVRHVLEHAHDLRRFLDGTRTLMAPSGYVIFEVPDCGRALQDKDYSTLWEEHVWYFSPTTLRRSLMLCGFSIVNFASYPYTLENSLVVIAQPANKASTLPATAEEQSAIATEMARARAFGAGLEETRARWQHTLARWRREVGREAGPVALLGAGHLSCTFLNLLQIGSLIEFVVDDNPHKQGLFMPGSRLPIYPSQALFDREVRLCLMSVSPESEARVMERNQRWLETGGRLASIFPGSRMAMTLDA